MINFPVTTHTHDDFLSFYYLLKRDKMTRLTSSSLCVCVTAVPIIITMAIQKSSILDSMVIASYPVEICYSKHKVILGLLPQRSRHFGKDQLR